MENFMRMRLKMKRNYNFNDHRDAIRSPSSAAAGSVPESPEDVLKSVLPAVRKDFFLMPADDASRPDLSKLDQEDIDSDIAKPPTPSQASSTATSPAVTPVSGPEKSIFMVPCEMIRPMRVIKGMLEITSVALKFREISENDKAYVFFPFFLWYGNSFSVFFVVTTSKRRCGLWMP
jgi:hypothetical protein